MKVFMWPSVALANYGNGSIIAAGRDIEEARQNAREGFSHYMMERYIWNPETFTGYLDPEDEDDAKSIKEKWKVFEEDISCEPEENAAFLIPGSE